MRQKKWSNSKIIRGNSNDGDISINEVANSEHVSKSGRLPKRLQSNCGGKSIAVRSQEPPAGEDFDEEEDDGEIERSSKSKSKAAKTRGRVDMAAETEKYSRYPFDFWVVLSNYILPEDVCRFSLVCRDTYLAVSQASFWRGLYSDLCRGLRGQKSTLPGNLSPDSMTRTHQLKLHVIRSLYYIYPPFVLRMKSKTIGDPHTLKGSICVKWWQDREVCGGGKGWRFFFQFQKRAKFSTLLRKSTAKRKEPDDFAMSGCGDDLGDIFDNPDEHRCILQLSTSSFSRVAPTVLGMKLQDVCLAISVSQSLALTFIPAHQRSNQCDAFQPVNISDVKRMHIWPWHFPQYAALCEQVN